MCPAEGMDVTVHRTVLGAGVSPRRFTSQDSASRESCYEAKYRRASQIESRSVRIVTGRVGSELEAFNNDAPRRVTVTRSDHRDK